MVRWQTTTNYFNSISDFDSIQFSLNHIRIIAQQKLTVAILSGFGEAKIKIRKSQVSEIEIAPAGFLD